MKTFIERQKDRSRAFTARRVCNEFVYECTRQDEKWGEQRDYKDFPTGHNFVQAQAAAQEAKSAWEAARADGDENWWFVLIEEILEASAEPDLTKLRTELIQSGAVIIQWIRSIDRRLKLGEGNGAKSK